jgi:hypothetical protein
MIFKFDNLLVGAGFENKIAETLRTFSDFEFKKIRDAQFDLSKVEFMDCYCAQIFICYIRLMERQGTHLTIRLPESKRVRDMMRVWHLDMAILDAVGKHLIYFCENDQKERYFYPHDRQSTFDLRYFPKLQLDSNNPETERVDLNLNENFFGFRSIKVPDDVDEKPICANIEKRTWQNFNIKTLLEKDLKLDVRYFSARIIFEAVFNALRHPSADIVQTATHTRHIYEAAQLKLSLHTEKKDIGGIPRKSIVTHYWDDGESMLDIIIKNLKENKEFRTSLPGDYAKKYRLSWRGRDEQQNSIDKVVSSNHGATSSSHISDMIVFVLQPFVSTSPDKIGHASSKETKEDNPRLASVGMGLYLLLDTAIGMFDGKVRIRTSNIHVTVSKGKKMQFVDGIELEKHDYMVEIKEMSEKLPKFLGNIITVSIPEQRSGAKK